MKFVCPKMKWEYNKADKTNRRVCHCDNPCTTSSCGRMIYIYPEQNLRAYPGTVRGTQEWDSTYKIRVNVEKSINHFKDSFCVAGRKTQNENLPKILFSVLSYLKPGKTGCFHCLKQDYEIVSQLSIQVKNCNPFYVLHFVDIVHSHVKYCFFHNFYTLIRIFLYIITPEPNNGPAFKQQFLIYFIISLSIPRYLAYPEFTVITFL